MSRLPLLALAGLVIAGVAIVAGTSSALPPTVVTHFGWAGTPDGFATRGQYTAFMILQLVGEPLLVLAAFVVLPRFAPRLLSLPNRDYWLEPPRRAATLATLARYGAGMAVALVGLMTGLHLAIVRTNATVPPQMPLIPMIAIVAAFVVFAVAWSWRLHRRFRRRD